MGGRYGEVRGSSKTETYFKYAREIERSDILPHADPNPRYKKQCKREMVQDPETGKWVLAFHQHT